MNLLIGRLHPLLVHLPIGILLVALLCEWLSRKEKYQPLKATIPILLWTGAIVAIISCVTGYTLSLQNDYDQDILPWHLAMGISTAILATALFFLHRSNLPGARKFYNAGCLFLLIVIAVTGHLGGSLTHGSSYLSEALPAPLRGWFSGSEDSNGILNVQNALIYNDIVKPILNEKCVACHGESRQKGGLRLDLPEGILKGGKKGKTVVAGKPFDSELIERIYLPLNHEHHMPPKGKSQISPAEAQLIQWWIEEGADFKKRVSDLVQTETIKPILESLQSSDLDKTIFVSVDMPEGKVDKVHDSVLLSFRNRNIALVPMSRDSHFLSASFAAFPEATDEELQSLVPFAKNIMVLKLGNTRISDKALEIVARFENLFQLNLEHTAVTDAGLSKLKSLSQLRYFNLVGTSVTPKGILELVGLKKLKKVYLYQTTIDKNDWATLDKKFPGVKLDWGGYEVSTFESDTTKMTVKKK